MTDQDTSRFETDKDSSEQASDQEALASANTDVNQPEGVGGEGIGACHGDDFVFVGADEELTWIQELVEGWFEVKVRGYLGPESCKNIETYV